MANQPKKYKKFVATAATATLVASAIVPVASAASFSDVPESNEFAPYINALTDEGIINGYPSTNTFKPGAALTRGQVVKMLGRWVENNGVELPSDWKTKAYFKDVPTNHKDQELVKYAALVAKAGVFGGAAGNLMAEKNITRQQMAKVLNGAYAAVNGESLVEIAEGVDNVRIPDLGNASAEYEDAIQALMNLEISSTTSGNFRPLENVTRAQFSKFLYNTINFEASDVAPFEIKAVNNTTVEVIFEDEIENIDKVKFEIDGLKVTNAVVKQTSKRTAVLTTESQKGGTEYTVKVDGEKAGTFVGIAAVVPSKVELVSSSVQGKLGQEVKVQAKVTVAEGQSKAGIPVTFSIPGLANDAVYPTVTGEAYTDENGVATYTYTRYGAGTDAVTAYATGDRSKFAVGYVFWGVDTILSITEVTEGATINNGANKNYKVKVTDPATGKAATNKRLLVSIAENLNVTIDKVQEVKVNGQYVKQLTNGTAPVVAEIVTDSKGEATFTVSGVNADATPVVYEPVKYQSNGTILAADRVYTQSALQATGTKVKFAAVQADYTIELTRDGGEEAAVASATQTNGRKYNVVVKDKNGNPAKFETLNIDFNEKLDRVLTTNTSAYFVQDDVKKNGPIQVKTNAKGEASFVIASNTVNDYATPLAWIDGSGSTGVDGSFDVGEAHSIADITYFTAAKLTTGTLTVYNGNTKTTEFKGTEKAKFQLDLANQSGKAISLADAGYTSIEAEFTVHNDGPGNILVDGNEVAPNRHITLTRTATSPTIEIQPKGDVTTNVRVVVNGTAKDSSGVKAPFVFTTKEATAKFTSTASVITEKTYSVLSFDTDAKELTFVGKDAISYADKDVVAYFNTGSVEISEEEFERELLAAVAANTAVTITYKEDADGNVTLKLANTAVVPTLTSPAVKNVTGKVYVTNVATTATAKTYKAGESFDVTLTFSEKVNGATDLDLADSGSFTKTVAQTVTASNKVTFTYTVAATDDTVGNDLSATTIDLSALLNTASTPVAVTDELGLLTSFGSDYLSGVKVDGVAPTVATKLLAAATGINTTSLVFSEALDATSKAAVKTIVEDALTLNGDATAVVTWAADNKTLNVTVTNGTGSVDLAALVIPASFKVKDLAGNESAVLTAGDLQN